MHPPAISRMYYASTLLTAGLPPAPGLSLTWAVVLAFSLEGFAQSQAVNPYNICSNKPVYRNVHHAYDRRQSDEHFSGKQNHTILHFSAVAVFVRSSNLSAVAVFLRNQRFLSAPVVLIHDGLILVGFFLQPV